MTKIKLCGLKRECDIQTANKLQPDYVGFVFAEKSSRCVSPEEAAVLKGKLRPEIKAVGVFVKECPKKVAELLKCGIIDVAQLHGGEDEAYIKALRELTDKPVIKAFRIEKRQDVLEAVKSSADMILLDAGSGGTGTAFDWSLLAGIERPYFLAGGLDAGNVSAAIKQLAPYGVDVSSGIETEGLKDKEKMEAFVNAVRKDEKP